MGRELLGKRLAMGLLLGLVANLVPTAAMAAPTPCADLRITNLVMIPDSPVQGAQATMRIVVQNQGTCAAPGFVVQWRQDVLAQTGPSTGLSGLNAGASVTVNLPFIFPQSGNFLTITTIDTGNSVDETNEANNFQILSVTVQAATVDLLVTTITFSPTPVVQGRTATASVVVTNQGTSPSGPFVVEWHPFLFATALTLQTPSLGAGESRTIPFDFSFPFAMTLDTWASVDTTFAVAEIDEFNNTFATRVVVEPPLPDLVVSSFTLNPSVAIPGTPATATIVVKNEGNDPAGAFQIDWRPWLFGPTLSKQVNSLAVGATATLTLDYNFPFPGSFPSFITVDSTSRVAEVDEVNNTLQVQLSVAPNVVDLTITNVIISPASPVQGAQASVAIVIRNNGNTPAGPFVLEWNPDAFFIVTPSLQTVSQQLTGLGAGETRMVNLNFTYPRAGNFNTVARVDAFGNIAESNETNNLFVKDVTVAPAPIDLEITSFTVSPATPVRFAQTTANITVRNNGPIASNDFAVQWKLKNTDAFGPIAFTNGLNAGESRTITLTGGIYFDIGTFTTQAIVDVFNGVVEPGGGENNNTASTSVTVQPLTTTVRVTLQSLHVINDLDGADPDSEKFIDFGVLNPRDPQSTCTIDLPFQNQSVNGFKCLRFSPDLEDGDTFSPNASIDVTLQDLEPLVAAVSMLDSDFIPPDEYMGVAVIVTLPPAFAPLGPQTIDGQACEESNGRCFTVTLSVSIVSTNAPASAISSTAGANMAMSTVGAGDPATSLSVIGGGAASSAATEAGASLSAGFAEVSLNSGITPYATAVNSLRQNGYVVSEAAVPASPPIQHARLFVDYRSAASGIGNVTTNTGIAIANISNATATLTFTLRDSNGVTIGTGQGDLAAGAHVAKSIDQLSELASNFTFPATFAAVVQTGSLEIFSNQPVSISALRFTSNQRGETLLTSTPIADLQTAGGTSPLHFPQFADGGGNKTSVVLLNTSASTETGSVAFFGDSGAPVSLQSSTGTNASSFAYTIPAGGTTVIETSGAADATQVGSTRVIPATGNASPAGAAILSFSPAGILATETGIPAAQETTSARVYIDTSDGHDTGIAIANTGSSSNMISVRAFQNDGSIAAGSGSATLNLPASGHTTRFVGELISGLPNQFTGVLEITSTLPFAATALRSLTNGRGESLLTTFPVADATQTAASPIVFPLILDGDGYSTTIHIHQPKRACSFIA